MEEDRLNEEPDFDLTLLANFVHQVINPINGVIGTLDNLIDGTIGQERRLQRTKAARAQLENCVALLRNLAFLVRAPQALDEDDLKTVVLPQVIIEAAMFYQEEAGNRGVRINLVDRRTENRCSAHPDLIRQVLMNIFDNCTKYSRSGSEVVVHQWIQRHTDTAMISIRSALADPISNADLERVFERGFRGNNAKKIVASGTGLGLFICKQIIEEMHNGRIEIERETDGLRFLIRIPGGVSV